jgi:hypothetical protein
MCRALRDYTPTQRRACRSAYVWTLLASSPLIPLSPSPTSSRADRKYVRYKPQTASQRSRRASDLPLSRSAGEGSGVRADCRSQRQKTHLCSNVLSARKLPHGEKGLPRVDFLGAMSDFLLSRALLPLIPPTPFSHKGRRGILGVLMAETGDGTQGLAKKSTPVRRGGGGVAS